MSEQAFSMTETDTLMTCRVHGHYHAKLVNLLGREMQVGDCPVCESEKQAKEQSDRKMAVQRQASDAIRSVIPPRFQSATFETYLHDSQEKRRALSICRKYADRWDDRKAKGGCLVLCGKPGTGKTHLAAGIMREVIGNEVMAGNNNFGLHGRNYPVIYTTVTEMMREVKSTYAKNSDKSEIDVIRKYSSVSLLVIDEIGASRGTETELITLQEIIDSRYQHILPTILISNLAESELAAYIGERAVDRMYENGGAVIAFNWESHRRAQS
jgi:DNA replication protein DnaC